MPTRTLQGTLTDAADPSSHPQGVQPIVQVARDGGWTRLASATSTVSNASGNYSATFDTESVSANDMRVVFTTDGGESTLQIVGGEANVRFGPSEPFPSGAVTVRFPMIVGELTDPTSSPMAGVTAAVEISSDGVGWTRHGTAPQGSNAGGGYAVPFDASGLDPSFFVRLVFFDATHAYTIMAGDAQWTVPGVPASFNASLGISEIVVTALYRDGLTPAEGFGVTLQAGSGPVFTAQGEPVITNAQGQSSLPFDAALIVAEIVRIAIEREGQSVPLLDADAVQFATGLVPAQVTVELDLEAPGSDRHESVGSDGPTPGVITGTVRDAASTGRRGVEVRLYSTAPQLARVLLASDWTSVEGTFTLSDGNFASKRRCPSSSALRRPRTR